MILVKKITLVLFIFLAIAVIIIHILISFISINDDDRLKFFASHEMNPIIIESIISDATVFNINTEETSDTAILFLHGAPGSWDAWKGFLVEKNLLKLGQLISIDRPGYGKSHMNEKQTSIMAQAEIIGKLMASRKFKDLTVVGHSYGAPIAAQLAIINPNIVNRVIMIAPLIDPDSEPIFWFSYFGKWAGTKWMLPDMLKIAANEKFSHALELEKLKTQWSQLKCPILHIHGLDDGLAPPQENTAFSRDLIPDSLLTLELLPDEGHLTIFENPPKIIGLITDFIKKNRPLPLDSDL